MRPEKTEDKKTAAKTGGEDTDPLTGEETDETPAEAVLYERQETGELCQTGDPHLQGCGHQGDASVYLSFGVAGLVRVDKTRKESEQFIHSWQPVGYEGALTINNVRRGLECNSRLIGELQRG